MELLVEIGRFDLGEDVAGPHSAADVAVPPCLVAAHAREKRCPRIGLEAARQLECHGAAAYPWWCNLNDWGARRGYLLEMRESLLAAADADRRHGTVAAICTAGRQ